MRVRTLPLLAAGMAALWLLSPAPARAQGFTPPEGLGSITLSWQFVENTGHIFTDGFYLAAGPSVTTSLTFDVEYGVSDRFALNASIPYIFAKFTGDQPPLSGLPHDECRCWNSGFQDFGVAARYRLGTSTWAVTPLARVSIPSRNYEFQGEAVVGRRLRELQVGVSSSVRLPGALRRASVSGTYVYAIVDRPLRDISLNRSNTFLDFGYALNRRLFVRGSGTFQRTHGGLRVGSPTGNPFLPFGELGERGSERYQQRDRIQRSHYWQAGGGASYSFGSFDVFGSVMKYVWGRDSHNGRIYNAGVSWYFDVNQ